MRKVKLSWAEQFKMKEKKTEEAMKINQLSLHQRLEVKVSRNSLQNETKSVDYYDIYLMEKAKSRSERQTEKKDRAFYNENLVSEFHEQYFS